MRILFWGVTMSKVLIVSDNIVKVGTIRSLLVQKDIASETINVTKLVTQSSQHIVGYKFAVIYIDLDFYKRFRNALHELSNSIKNYASLRPIYLFFEGEYDPKFAIWLEHTKRIYQSVRQESTFQEAIEDILRNEADSVPRNPFGLSKDA